MVLIAEKGIFTGGEDIPLRVKMRECLLQGFLYSRELCFPAVFLSCILNCIPQLCSPAVFPNCVRQLLVFCPADFKQLARSLRHATFPYELPRDGWRTRTYYELG